MLKRSEVLQRFLSFFAKPTYLEIGVSKGATFKAIRAARKIAVDPAFQLDVTKWQVAMPKAEFHAVTSDEYFGHIVKLDQRFDVIYLDGLHTSEQTLRDLLNSLSYIKQDGVTVIDDIYPPNYAASLPSQEKFRRLRRAERFSSLQWMGDVYRVAPFIATFCQQWTFRCISDNHGQLVLWKSRRKVIPERTIASVAQFSYEAARLGRKDFYFRKYAEILAEFKAQRAASDAQDEGC